MPYQAEANMQEQVAQYMRYQYPGIIFRSDFAAGIKMTPGQAAKHKRMQQGRAYPDFFIALPHRKYHGCYLELKQSRASHLPYLKNGNLSRDKHIQEQALTLRILNTAGYYARFAVGFEQAKEIIDWYMSEGNKEEPAHTNGVVPKFYNPRTKKDEVADASVF